MSNAPITHTSIKQLTLAYASMFCILLFLLISAQVLVQVALARGTHVRTVAAMIERQEIRTQRMFYNVLILQSPGTPPGQSYMDISHLVLSDEPAWEQIQQAMYAGDARVQISPSDFSASATSMIAKEKSGYITMRDAYRRVLAAEQAKHPAAPEAVRPDINVIYLAEGPYLASLINIYEDVTQEADSYVTSIRTIEVILFLLSAVVLPSEAFFVARPAVRHLREQMQLLAQTLHLDDPPKEKKP